jgi:hypothetical protein
MSRKAICSKCKEVKEGSYKIMNYKLNERLTVKGVKMLVCDTCQTQMTIAKTETPKIKEALDNFKMIRPNIESIIFQIPIHQRSHWVSHKEKDGDMSLSCNCKKEEDKGVNCNGILSSYLYTKKDWEIYMSQQGLI